MEAAQPPEFALPYIPFRTLLNAIERMEAEGMPSRLDRSYLSNLPWSSQNHFLAASRSLGLIDADGKPTRLLVRLVDHPDERAGLMGQMLQKYYPASVALGTNATQEQLEETFREFGLAGSTMRKAVAFYLHAAKFAQLPLSPHFRSPRTTERSTTARRRTKARQPSASNEGATETDVAASDGLRSSGLHPFLQGLLRELPQGDDASWTDAKRTRWLQMAELTVDMLYPVEDKD